MWTSLSLKWVIPVQFSKSPNYQRFAVLVAQSVHSPEFTTEWTGRTLATCRYHVSIFSGIFCLPPVGDRVLFSFTLFVEYSGTFRKFKIFYCLDLFSKSLHFSARWYISMRLLWYTTVSSCCQVQLWDRMAKLHCTSGGCAWVSQRSSSVWKYWSALLHLWGAFGTCFWWWTPTNRT